MTEVPSLRRRVLRGVVWTTGTTVLVQASRFAIAIILVRLLTPHEYGIAAMALILSSLVLMVSDFGLGTALVQRATITEADRSTVFWTSTAVGAALAGIGVLMAGPVAAFFGEPEVEPLFMVVAATFLLGALGKTHAALFQRAMAFRAISVRLISGTLVGGAVGIVLAAQGEGAWALVWMQVANGATVTILMWAFSPWRPHLVYSRTSLRNLGRFGLNIFGSKIFEYLHGNADKVLVGRFLGAPSLGVYNVAYNLVVLPWLGLLLALVDAVFPAMSRFQHDRPRVAAAWLNATRLLMAIAGPAMLGLVVVAPDFVLVVLGDQWEAAVPVIQLMALAMAVHSATTFGTTVFTALDRTGVVLRFTIVEVVFIVAALTVAVQWGMTEVAAAYLGVIVVMRSTLVWLTARALAVPLRNFARNVAPVAQAVLGMALVAWAVRYALVELDVPAAVRLVVVPVIGALAYAGFVAWRAPEILREARQLVRRRPAAPEPVDLEASGTWTKDEDRFVTGAPRT